MKKIKVIFNLEKDYRVEVYDDKGFKEETQDINQEELGEVVDEICMLATGNKEDSESLKQTLRTIYSVGQMKSMSINIGE